MQNSSHFRKKKKKAVGVTMNISATARTDVYQAAGLDVPNDWESRPRI